MACSLADICSASFEKRAARAEATWVATRRPCSVKWSRTTRASAPSLRRSSQPRRSRSPTNRLTVLFSRPRRRPSSRWDSAVSSTSSVSACAVDVLIGCPHGVCSGSSSPKARTNAIVCRWSRSLVTAVLSPPAPRLVAGYNYLS